VVGIKEQVTALAYDAWLFIEEAKVRVRGYL